METTSTTENIRHGYTEMHMCFFVICAPLRGYGEQHLGCALIVMASLFGLTETQSWGAVGDPVASISPQPGIGSQFCSIGLAFDGSWLYFNRCSDPNVYAVSAQNGSTQEAKSLIETDPQNPRIPEWPAAMAFDAKRNGLWIGTQKTLEGPGFGNCGDPLTVNTDMPIYFWDFDDGSVTLMFAIPSDLTNPANGQKFFSFCRIDGLVYNENDPSTTADDEIWFSDLQNANLGVFRPDGTFVGGFDATTVDSLLGNNTGLEIGADRLYMTDDGGSHVIRTSRIPDAASEQLLLGTLFTNGNGWLTDMACDAVTFAPVGKTVIWVRTSLNCILTEPSCGSGQRHHYCL